jgi:hypothetical protein
MFYDNCEGAKVSQTILQTIEFKNIMIDKYNARDGAEIITRIMFKFANSLTRERSRLTTSIRDTVVGKFSSCVK